VFADAFIGMNVTIHEGGVVAARAVVVKDMPAFAIVAGNPGRVVGSRQIA
jgi:acetyltransferase-like isoleucine patch superfamily enzyme